MGLKNKIIETKKNYQQKRNIYNEFIVNDVDNSYYKTGLLNKMRFFRKISALYKNHLQ